MMTFENKKLCFFFVLIFFLLSGRLAYLTLIKGSDYRARADQNRLLSLETAAPRGIIYDRNHRSLAINVPRYQKEDKVISRDEFLSCLARGEDKNVSLSYARQYPLEEAAAHVLGYLGPVTSAELEKGYGSNDMVGRGGVEEFYDHLLRGQAGKRVIEVDTKGRFLREVERIAPIAGHDLYLNLDASLQKKAADLIFPAPGAVVVSDPRSGAVLAMVSSPSFDPNLFTFNRREEEIASLLKNPLQPFLNRAISARYPPGSTFKMVTAIAGLEEGKIEEDTKIEDVGILRVGEFEYANWLFTKYGRTDGEVDVVKAIKRSNDIYFYKVGEFLGATLLSSWAEKFGLGKKTGIDLPAEVGGVVPSPSWKEEVKGEPWFLGDTYHLAIGQGDLAVTPLAVNMVTNVIANDGWWCPPRVVKDKSEENRCRFLDIKEENIRLVRQGMREACLPGGTGTPFFNFRLRGKEGMVACKTGTAEFGIKKEKTHAWFTAFAPWDKPEVSVTVFLEGGGEGSGRAAVIAKEILESYFMDND